MPKMLGWGVERLAFGVWRAKLGTSEECQSWVSAWVRDENMFRP
jgi:hypothetical protein